MKPCSNDGNCRLAYLCALPSQITPEGTRSATELPQEERIARIIDLEDDKASSMICAALVEDEPMRDAGVEPDTGAQ